MQYLYGSFRFAIGHPAFSRRRTSTSRLRFGAFAQVAEPAFSTAEIWTKTSRQSCLPRISRNGRSNFALGEYARRWVAGSRKA